MIAAAKKPPEARAKTSIQIEVDTGTGRLDHYDVYASKFCKYREMRRDPTIALGRAFVAAPILAATWTVEGDEEHQVEFIREQLFTRREELVRTAVYGMIDFGWRAYEKVFEAVDIEVNLGDELDCCDINPDVKEEETLEVTHIGIGVIKALKNDHTWFLYCEKGKFIGLENQDIFTGAEVHIDADHSLYINYDEDGLGEYGAAMLANCERAYDEWLVANEAAARYDKKMAGEHWVVYYPIGRTHAEFMTSQTDEDGRISNDRIASEILKQLCASGSVSIPTHTEQIIANLQGGTDTGWKIELLSSAGMQHTFVDRLTYLDSLKIRGLLVPERAVLEGQFGTKAEAEAHADAGLVVRQLQHEFITDQINKQLVDQLIEYNYEGKPGSVKLVAVPLADEKAALYKELFMKLIDNPEAATEVLDGVDFDELRRTLGVPFDPDSDEAKLDAMLGGVPPVEGDPGSLVTQPGPATVAQQGQVGGPPMGVASAPAARKKEPV